MAKPLLSIIYVNFDSTDYLLASLRSLNKHTHDLLYEIIIVDNSSNKTEAERLRTSLASHCAVPAGRQEESGDLPAGRHGDSKPQSPLGRRQSQKKQDCHASQSLARNDKSGTLKISFIKSPDNKGFGAANNLGSKKASGQYLLFLNPDTLIVDDSIVKMVGYLKTHHEVGALSPLLYNPDGQLQKHFYGKFSSLFGITLGRWTGRKDKKIAQLLNNSSASNPPLCHPELTLLCHPELVSGSIIDSGSINCPHPAALPVDMVSGAAMMVKKELFEKIDGFDENFFMYLEDDDLCRRLWCSGYQNRVLTTAKITHLEGRSSDSTDKKKRYYQSQDYYFRKHYGLFVMLIMKLIRFPYKALKLLDK